LGEPIVLRCDAPEIFRSVLVEAGCFLLLRSDTTLGSACTYARHNGWFVITRLDRVAGSQRPGRAAFSATGSTSTPRLNLIDSVQRRDVRPVSRNSVRAQRHRSRDIGNIPVAFL